MTAAAIPGFDSIDAHDLRRLPASHHFESSWNEPAGAATPRGWYYPGTNLPRGWYLDYGLDHYRSPHRYCSPDDLCPDCQPGHILACRYPNGPGTRPHDSRWFVNVDDARRWVETGHEPSRNAR